MLLHFYFQKQELLVLVLFLPSFFHCPQYCTLAQAVELTNSVGKISFFGDIFVGSGKYQSQGKTDRQNSLAR